MEVYKSSGVEETLEIAQNFAKRLRSGDVVLYTGEMGAGKTHFTKGIARAFGVEDEVTSPTFALVNEYQGDFGVFHFDLFRINSYDDLYAIGFFDYLDRDGVLCIEWSENIPSLGDNLESVYYVDIKKLDENSRQITIEKKES